MYTPSHSTHLRYPCMTVQLPLILKDVLVGRDWAILEMPSEGMIEWTQRGTWRPGSSEFEDAF